MAEPISIITLVIAGGLALHQIIKAVFKCRNKNTLVSECCTKVHNVDLHESNHNEEIHIIK